MIGFEGGGAFTIRRITSASPRRKPERRHFVARWQQRHRQRTDEFAERRKYRNDDGQCAAREGTKHRRRRFRPVGNHMPVDHTVN